MLRSNSGAYPTRYPPIMSREKFLPREKFLKAGPAPPRFHLSSPRVQAARREPRASGASPRKPGPKKIPQARARERSSGCAGISSARDVECGSPLPSVSASDILSTERAAPSGGSGGFLGAAVLTRSDVQPPAGAGSHAVGGNLDVVGFARARPRLMPDPSLPRALCGCRSLRVPRVGSCSPEAPFDRPLPWTSGEGDDRDAPRSTPVGESEERGQCSHSPYCEGLGHDVRESRILDGPRYSAV
jgi:hypothetical protein